MAKVSLEKDKIKFLLVEGVHQKAIDSLRAAGYTNIEFHKGALDTEELKASIRDAHFIGLRSRTHLTEDVIAAAEKLVAIGCFCIGTNQVDLNAAAKRGIPVFNAPFSNTRSVAELVIGELLLLLRGIPEANAKAHRGVWNKLAAGSYEARGKKLGIIGYGHIGTQLGILAESLGKRLDKQGNVVNYGRTPIVAVGTTDMHAQTQEHQEGPQDKVVQFVSVENWPDDVTVPHLYDEYPKLAAFSGLPLSQILEAARSSNAEALAGDGRPSANYILPALTPYHLGELMFMLCLSIAYEGEYANVDAFNQPGVEVYKKFLGGRLKKLQEK